MSIEVRVPPAREQRVYTTTELEVGVLYKTLDSSYETVYTKTLSNTIVFFENPTDGTPRIGTYPFPPNEKFVRAPEGTKVILT